MSADTHTKMRWLVRRDFPQVIQIEKECFRHPWLEADFSGLLRRADVTGKVADCGGVVLGYVIYEMHRRRYEVLNLAVRPTVWREGIGELITNNLKTKLHPERRHRITLNVAERNLAAQNFFKAQGFIADGVLPEHWEDGQDGYAFTYRLPEPRETQSNGKL
jgi:ribosomal-protein-alanine N-acetyltransferase